MSNSSGFWNASLMLLPLYTHAAELPELSFSHNDWEIACDNTRTCRAAGYQSDEQELPVSVLLTRKAGPNEPVAVELMIGNDEDELATEKLPPVLKLAMSINKQALGDITLNQETYSAKLSVEQVAALLAALPHNSTIVWTAGEKHWQLSDKGAAAVLLKMDEFQGRLGTPGALIKKGNKPEAVALPPLPMPVINAAPVTEPHPGDEQWLDKHSEALQKALRATVSEDDCADLLDNENGDKELAVNHLTENKLLVSARCWSAAYNFGYGYWVVNDSTAYAPVLVTTSGSDYSEGVISSGQKGRGLGDCWSNESWAWNGKEFVQTEKSTTGMCKMVAPGGAWSLPTLVTDIRRPAR